MDSESFVGGFQLSMIPLFDISACRFWGGPGGRFCAWVFSEWSRMISVAASKSVTISLKEGRGGGRSGYFCMILLSF